MSEVELDHHILSLAVGFEFYGHIFILECVALLTI